MDQRPASSGLVSPFSQLMGTSREELEKERRIGKEGGREGGKGGREGERERETEETKAI